MKQEVAGDVTARAVAMRLLSRREHSQLELRRKLRRRGYDEGIIESVIDRLITDNLLSDERFAQALVYTRTERGYGPLRIAYDLRESGVGAELIESVVDADSETWRSRLCEILLKKFGAEPPTDYKEWARRANYLQRRGFSTSLVRAALKIDDSE